MKKYILNIDGEPYFKDEYIKEIVKVFNICKKHVTRERIQVIRVIVEKEGA